MSHFNAVRKLRHSVVRPARHGIRMIAVIIAALVGLAGNFMEASPKLSALDMGDVVEQIQATIERRESLKDMEGIVKQSKLDQLIAA